MQSDDDDENDGPDNTEQVNATYDHPEHIVTVTTVCDVDLTGGSTTIGVNKVQTVSRGMIKSGGSYSAWKRSLYFSGTLNCPSSHNKK